MRVLLLSLLVSAFAHADTKTLTIYSSFDTPGYNEITNGVKTGFEIELANAIFESQGYTVDWQEKSWTDIVADLAVPSGDKSYVYIASIEGRAERQANWLFATANEFDASHYFFAPAGSNFATGTIVDTGTGKQVPNFLLDVPANLLNGKPVRIGIWKDSAFEIELRRAYPNPVNVEIVAMDGGDPIEWLKNGQADVVYSFASGPKNSYTSQGFAIVAGPITNFDLDRFGGTSPVLPMNYFGQKVNRVWSDGFAAIIRDDTFFDISMKWFGRVSWPAEFNDFLLSDPAAFQKRIRDYEKGCAAAVKGRRRVMRNGNSRGIVR